MIYKQSQPTDVVLYILANAFQMFCFVSVSLDWIDEGGREGRREGDGEKAHDRTSWYRMGGLYYHVGLSIFVTTGSSRVSVSIIGRYRQLLFDDS